LISGTATAGPDLFSVQDVPEDERKAVARDVANKIIAKLGRESASAGTADS